MTQKIGLVTGGSRGLGKSAALAMAAQGIDVILTYHSQSAAAEKNDSTRNNAACTGLRAVMTRVAANTRIAENT